ncbi:L-cysteine:1D-myo-inositol 2-amino-2-deoxy-alpha-D-glucopyranoside ligase [Jatrophihabitans endophyticus]|uniref:L-cysteine:1D-myo-inositol 2-amino-2-deoxy-alpha-D-glucopyranoside ligase n=1 Tax=Jatrophihabitans endophyticus TaxID=1206085 RepID=A0A1M5BZD6_9ACTN|nr:cysteine--1-D-myo-inosityl 2-amino-2-deoxy-alpha-D-glucopyranoside ligase [Jatrophihabitans endophyticus]SHF47707.1 L-cysteine:1D-myo-inositol 2-amino-2-deoxy-alpha-D-glucopyranoside ligase [Jatrophihabitans endophyticus]
MDAWSSPAVPELAGTGPALRLFDTATGEVRETTPGPTARMYVCGITPYDATHLGHAATYLAFDLVQRVWRDAGHRVHYVQNVTDVDDPLLERAEQTGESWEALAARETRLFCEDMTALRVLAPDDFVGAVEAVPEITVAIEGLLERGAAYRLDDDVYFPVSAAAGFGRESGYDRDTMLALFGERGGDPDRAGKKDALDSLLWRGRRPDEPSWDSPLGPGRPGWHIECSVIALNRLGMAFDVQGGGSDLIFPHHEHSAAHAEALTGEEPFARFYVHAGMIGLDGEKMSKSRGNLVLVSKLRAAHIDPMAVRLALLDGHYRADREWTGGRLPAAEARLSRWRVAVGQDAGPAADAVLAQVRAALADDLDTVRALAAVDRWVESAGGEPDGPTGAATDAVGTDPDAPRLVRDLVDALLGVAL